MAVRSSWIAGVAGLLALMAGCGSDGVSNPCTAGLTVACPCLGGSPGVQVCTAAGSFGACTCPDASAPDVTADAALDATQPPDAPVIEAAQESGPPADAAVTDGAAMDVVVDDATDAVADAATDSVPALDSPSDVADAGDAALADVAPSDAPARDATPDDAPTDAVPSDALTRDDSSADAAGPWDPCAPGSLVDLNARGTTTGAVTRFVGDTSAASAENSLYCPCAPRTSHQVALQYVPRGTGGLRISAANAGTAVAFDTVVWAQSRCVSLRPDMLTLGCNDDGNVAPNTRASVFDVPAVTAGTPIVLVVAGFAPPASGEWTDRGAFELTVTEQPGVAIGGACDPTGAANVCLADGACANLGGAATCVVPGAHGGRWRSGTPACDAGLDCRGTPGDAASRCRATVPAGGPCDPSERADVCATGATCVVSGASSTCAPDGQRDARCRTGGAAPCDAGLGCDASNRCRAALAAGATCDPARVASVSATTASCVTQGGTSTCVNAGTFGGPCRAGAGETPCNAGLDCVAGSCRVTIAPGMPCDPADVARVCTAGYTCVLSGFGASCAADGTRGARCNAAAPRCGTSLDCMSDLYCRQVVLAGGACDLTGGTFCAAGNGCAPTSLTAGACPTLRPEVEPNDAPATPHGPVSGSTVFSGSVESMGRDCFAVVVPSGASLLAQTILTSAPSCASSGADTVVTVFNPAGAVIARDDNAPGRGLCSRVAPDLTPALRGLAAGTYVACVEGAGGATVSGYQFVVGVVPAT